MANLTRDEILARRTGRGLATLPDGGTVAIRALTRDQIMEVQDQSRTLQERDTLMIALGMTDPVMTEEEVAEWAANAPAGDLTAVSEGIADLSGLRQGAGKSRVASA
jgi:hypothetical protein